MKKKVSHYRPQVSSSQDFTVCLVAGGAGFIGSHLCESLLGQNCFVYCLDNFSTGREANIAQLKAAANFQVINHDLNSREKLKLPQKVDYVFHVAGVEAYLNGLDVALETLLVNSFGTKILLELAQENEAKFLLASSEQVYSGFVTEQNLNQYFGVGRTWAGEGAFAEAKRFAEALTFEYSQKKQVNARIVRLDFLYGPRMNLESGSMLAKLFKEAIEGDTLHIPGNGLTRLYPTFISDAVYGLVKAMFSQSSKGRVYTLVNPAMVAILNLAYLLRDARENQLKIEFVTGEDLYNFDFPQKSILDSQELLGWYPKVEAKEGVRLTLAELGQTILKKAQPETKIAEPSPQAPREEPIKSPLISALPKPAITISRSKINPADAGQRSNTRADSGAATKLGETPSFITPTAVKKTEVGVDKAEPVAQASKKSPILAWVMSFKKIKPKSLNFHWFSRYQWWLLALCLTVMAALLPIALFAYTTYQGARALRQIPAALEKGEIETVAGYNQRAKTNFFLAQRLLHGLSWITTGVGLQSQTQLADQVLQVGNYLTDSLNQLWLAGQEGEKLMAITLGKEVGDPLVQLEALEASIAQANNHLGLAEAELNKIYPQFSQTQTLEIGPQLTQLKNDLPAWRRLISEGQRLLLILPGVLQFRGKQTYLVLLQNNQELRPTGGFIGSFALVTLEKGKILDFTVEDIYAADGQLKGYVEPPEPIKKYLGEKIWWFRDANISPDFPTTAARSAWFLQKEMNREVAGVVGINLRLAQNLLTVIGPVYLADYQEQITADNIFERAEYHAEVNFFPGSTQKKDFLGSLARAIFENMKQLEPNQLASLAQVMVQSLNERAIMIWLPGTEEAKLLSQYGWDGALREPPQILPEFGPVDLTDYLMPVEANFGVNKANYFLKRQSGQEVTILKDGRIKEVFTLNLTNTSPSDAWPAGRYKNYLRLYLPLDARVEAVRISKKKGEMGDQLKPKDVEIKTENGKQMVGFLVEVPSREERLVKVEYGREKPLPLDNTLVSYLFYWQKQSGIGEDPISLTINYPMFLKPLKLSSEAKSGQQTLTFTSDSGRDRLFAVTFSH